MIHPKYYALKEKQDAFLARKNNPDKNFYNGIYERYENPVLTRDQRGDELRSDLSERKVLSGCPR